MPEFLMAVLAEAAVLALVGLITAVVRQIADSLVEPAS